MSVAIPEWMRVERQSQLGWVWIRTTRIVAVKCVEPKNPTDLGYRDRFLVMSDIPTFVDEWMKVQAGDGPWIEEWVV